MDKKQYKKHGGRVGTMGSSYTVWFAADHFLLCEDVQFQERYKCFYFKDIQALTCQKTKKNFVTNIVTLSLCVLFVGSALLSPPGWNIFLYICGVIPGLLLIINLFKGESCKTIIKTAVQSEELAVCNTIGRFNRFLDRLLPLVHSSQDSLNSEVLQSKYAQMLSKPNLKPASQPVLQSKVSWQHPVLYGVMMLWSLLVGVCAILPSHPLLTVMCIVYLAVMVFNIMAVVAQSRLSLKPSLSTWTWVTVGCIGLYFVIGYICFIMLILAASKNGRFVHGDSMLDIITLIPDSPGVSVLLFIVSGMAFLVGVIGLILCTSPRHSNKSPSL